MTRRDWARRTMAIAMVMAVWLMAHPAIAADPCDPGAPADALAASEQLLRDGTAARAEKDIEKARSLLKEASGRRPTNITIRLALAVLDVEQTKFVGALEVLRGPRGADPGTSKSLSREVADRLAEPGISPACRDGLRDLQSRIQKATARAESKVPHVILFLPCQGQVNGLVVQLRDKKVVPNTELEADSGTAVIVQSAPGRADQSSSVVISQREAGGPQIIELKPMNDLPYLSCQDASKQAGISNSDKLPCWKVWHAYGDLQNAANRALDDALEATPDSLIGKKAADSDKCDCWYASIDDPRCKVDLMQTEKFVTVSAGKVGEERERLIQLTAATGETTLPDPEQLERIETICHLHAEVNRLAALMEAAGKANAHTFEQGQVTKEEQILEAHDRLVQELSARSRRVVNPPVPCHCLRCAASDSADLDGAPATGFLLGIWIFCRRGRGRRRR